jgi:hypothetical protein
MVSSVTPSRWAVEHFGEHAAAATECVVSGLVRAQKAAWQVQKAAEAEGASTKRPYGSMWDSRYNFVIERFELRKLPGYEAYRPKGASYSLAVVNGRVLIPFRHATTLGVPISQARIQNQIPRVEARRLGVEPSQPSLFDDPTVADGAGCAPTVAEAAAAAEAAEDLRVIYVGFVANAGSDEVLAAWWGEPTALEDDGSLVWTPEELDLSIATATSSGSTRSRLDVPGVAATTQGFAQGDVPPLNVATRDRQVDKPSAESEPVTPDAVDGDE